MELMKVLGKLCYIKKGLEQNMIKVICLYLPQTTMKRLLKYVLDQDTT